MFRSWSRSQKVAHLLQDLGLRHILPVQSMLIFKVLPLGSALPINSRDTGLADSGCATQAHSSMLTRGHSWPAERDKRSPVEQLTPPIHLHEAVS